MYASNNHFILVFILLMISLNIHAQKTERSSKVVQEIFLIGDTGYSPAKMKAKGLQALEAYIDKNDTRNAHLVFLGDNIYPKGMPPVND